MEEEVYRVKEYPNKEKGFFMDEEKFAKFSYDLFNVPIFAIICSIYLNILYIYFWKKQMNILSIALNIFINYLIIETILEKVFRVSEIK